MKKIVFVILITLVILFLGKDLIPFNDNIFEFHDISQASRIQQFSFNLKNFKIPPRIAPDFYYKLGYPVFNFYAPSAYWITSVINLTGISIVDSLKLSFLFALILSFIFSFLFLRCFFDFFPSLFGALTYITSLYFPADIFIRGNLAEIWFLTLLPLSLYFIFQNSVKLKQSSFVIGTIILSVTFTSHNLLSMIFIPVSIVFVMILKNKKINFISIILALLLSSYFWIPVVFESYLTIAKSMAEKTQYQNHFLCIAQLWDSPWGYGGSIPGCFDGMSFKIGKMSIIFSFFGIITFLFNIFRKKLDHYKPVACYLLVLLTGSLFMTTHLSKPVWDFLSPFLAVIQFPWRFISFSLIGIAFFSSYFWQKINTQFNRVLILFFILVSLIINAKYYQRKPISKIDYEQKFLSSVYIEEKAAFSIPEYFTPAQYGISTNFIKKLGPLIEINDPYYKRINIRNSDDLLLVKQVFSFPFWEMKVNDKIEITYHQTNIEKLSNILTLLTLFLLIIIFRKKSLWKIIRS